MCCKPVVANLFRRHSDITFDTAFLLRCVAQLRMQAVVLSRAVSQPSSDNSFYTFALQYSERLLGASAELLLFCSRVHSWPSASDLTESSTIVRKRTVVALLQSSLGSLLISALAFIGKLGVRLDSVETLAVCLQQVLCVGWIKLGWVSAGQGVSRACLALL